MRENSIVAGRRLISAMGPSEVEIAIVNTSLHSQWVCCTVHYQLTIKAVLLSDPRPIESQRLT
jgi:hypothetical protein